MRRMVKKAARRVVGVLVILVGILLLPLPGPGMVVIFAGATILGYGPHMRAFVHRIRERLAGRLGRRPAGPPAGPTPPE